MTLMSQAAFARHRGVSGKSVSIWKSKGLLVRDPDGRVDAEASDRVLEQRPERHRDGLATARAKLAAAERRLHAAARAFRACEIGLQAAEGEEGRGRH